MKIRTADFETSAFDKKGYPKDMLPEVAFAGRSNVGKSTLINTILNRKGLAKTSSTPGKTASINFFRVNSDCYFVDLPGYGYANRPGKVKASWKEMIETYFDTSERLMGVILLLDIRQTTDQDIQMRDWLMTKQIPAIFTLTKADKLPRSKRAAAKKKISQNLLLEETNDDLLLFSSHTKEGKNILLPAIRCLLFGK